MAENSSGVPFWSVESVGPGASITAVWPHCPTSDPSVRNAGCGVLEVTSARWAARIVGHRWCGRSNMAWCPAQGGSQCNQG